MLTVDFDRIALRRGYRVLDVGCGGGRHAFEAYRRGADVFALDRDVEELSKVERTFRAMAEAGEVPPDATATTVVGDALTLPFPDDRFDCVIASEVLEHIEKDHAAMEQLVRVVKPGGMVVVTVPRWFPEVVCWLLSDAYHEVDGGHVRIYREHALVNELCDLGLRRLHSHHAHALHSPYWWIKCVVGVDRANHSLAEAYHRLLVWDLTHRPWQTRSLERLLNPVIGKSLVIYLKKPEVTP